MFITTANYLDPIPPALRDRMEVIELAGYTEEEKLEIARRHLIPKQIEPRTASRRRTSTSLEDGIQEIIRSYTREAGLRNLEREIGRVCRKVARGVTEGKTERVTVDATRVHEFLGPERFFSEVAERVHEPGVATGLAWTPNGGEITLHRGHANGGQEGPDAHRSPRRGDEGVRAGGADLHPRARGAARSRHRLLRELRPPHARSGGRRPEGRPLRRRDDGHGAGFAADRPHRYATTWP